MGLEKKYRSYKDKYIDEGREHRETLEGDFTPDFFNRNTIQIWDVSAAENPSIKKWIGSTLTERTSHEISIVNNSGVVKEVEFNINYHLVDEVFEDNTSLQIGPNGTAYFYCTAILEDNNLVFSMRTGSQDDRKI
jgi:hypothetical protein